LDTTLIKNETVKQISVISMYLLFHTESITELHACKHRQYTLQKLKKNIRLMKAQNAEQVAGKIYSY
jgi:hypothetical protein